MTQQGGLVGSRSHLSSCDKCEFWKFAATWESISYLQSSGAGRALAALGAIWERGFKGWERGRVRCGWYG